MTEQSVDGTAPPPSRIRLADGRILVSPLLATARSLKVGEWVIVNRHPWQVSDVLFRHDGGRVVHLRGRRPLSLGIRDVVLVYRQADPDP